MRLVVTTLLFPQAMATPHLTPVTGKRQNTIPPVVTNPEPSSGLSNTDNRSSLSTTFIIAVAIAFGAFTLLVLLVIFRKKYTPWLRERYSGSTTSNPTSTRNVTAEQLSGGTAGNGTTNTTTTTTSTTTTTGARGARRSRRGVRRTESGASIRTLPVYSKEAADEELVLVRRRSQSGILEESFSDNEDENIVTGEGYVGDPEEQPIRRSSQRSQRVHNDEDEVDIGTQELLLPDQDSPATRSAPVGGRPVPARSSTGSMRRGWGEAPTYLEAMSSPSFRQDVEANAEVPPPRSRASSGFRDLLARAGMSFSPPSFRPIRPSNNINMTQRRPESSSTSLLLQPQVSRISNDSSFMPESPYLSPWASTHTLPHISSPVPNSAVRASFDETRLPKAGLSDSQMRFLSSSEAVNLVGVKLGDVPAGKRRRRSEAGLSVLSMGEGSSDGMGGQGEEREPPSWDEVDGERRRREADMRRGLARPPDRSGEESQAASTAQVEEPVSSVVDEGIEEGNDVALKPEGSPGGLLEAPRAALGNLSLNTSIPNVELVPPTPITPPPVSVSIK